MRPIFRIEILLDFRKDASKVGVNGVLISTSLILL